MPENENNPHGDIMPRYHFNFREAETLAVDETGTEFESLDVAYLDAFRAVQDIWHERLRARRDPRLCAFEIVDTAGKVLMVLPFSEVLESCQGDRALPPRSHRTLENTRRMERLVVELAQQIRMNQDVVRRARVLVGRSSGKGSRAA